MTTNEIITFLGLEPHSTEGHYFRRTWEHYHNYGKKTHQLYRKHSMYLLCTDGTPAPPEKVRS
ncbi:hypothetical protein VU04_10775 [Desulfobulbus sp. TB]|nr:hypothetical protein [Desulfobulbus sp. TB]